MPPARPSSRSDRHDTPATHTSYHVPAGHAMSDTTSKQQEPPADSGQDERHKTRMQRKKEVVDAKIEAAQDARGVIVVTTGNGKGKSSSGFGMVARALGHGMKVGVVQFIKGAFATGEERF